MELFSGVDHRKIAFITRHAQNHDRAEIDSRFPIGRKMHLHKTHTAAASAAPLMHENLKLLIQNVTLVPFSLLKKIITTFSMFRHKTAH